MTCSCCETLPLFWHGDAEHSRAAIHITARLDNSLVHGEVSEASCCACYYFCRLTNSIMMHGRNNGKKLMAVSCCLWSLVQLQKATCCLMLVSAASSFVHDSWHLPISQQGLWMTCSDSRAVSQNVTVTAAQSSNDSTAVEVL